MADSKAASPKPVKAPAKSTSKPKAKDKPVRKSARTTYIGPDCKVLGLRHCTTFVGDLPSNVQSAIDAHKPFGRLLVKSGSVAQGIEAATRGSWAAKTIASTITALQEG